MWLDHLPPRRRIVNRQLQQTQEIQDLIAGTAENRRRLGCLPPHYGHCADTILWAARDDPVAVGYINQDIALAIKETHDLERLEHKAAVFVKDAFTILELAEEPNRPYLATGNAGVARILRYAQGAFDAAGLGPGDMAGHALDLGVVKPVHHDLVIRTEPSKLGAHRAGCPAVGAGEEPPSEKHDDQKDAHAYNHYELFHHHSPFGLKTQTTTERYLKKLDDDLAVGLRLLEKKDSQWDTQIKMGNA